MKKIFQLFATPSPTMLATRELEQAQRSLLEAQSAHEYALHISHYHQQRITRLSQYLVDTLLEESKT